MLGGQPLGLRVGGLFPCEVADDAGWHEWQGCSPGDGERAVALFVDLGLGATLVFDALDGCAQQRIGV